MDNEALNTKLYEKLFTEQERELIDSFRETYGQISNLLLTTDYYKKIR